MAKFNFKSFKQKVKDNYQKVVNYTAVGGVAVASSMAHAEALDMSRQITMVAKKKINLSYRDFVTGLQKFVNL